MIDVVVCDLATLICLKVQRWDGELAPSAEYFDRNNPSPFNSRTHRNILSAFEASTTGRRNTLS